jgi:hypothetical protein
MPTDDKGLKAIEAKILVYANFVISFSLMIVLTKFTTLKNGF